MVRAVVVLVLERFFVVGGEVVAATTSFLAGRSRDLDQSPFLFFVSHRKTNQPVIEPALIRKN